MSPKSGSDYLVPIICPSYVAPNNHIHRAGKEAVKIAFPEIRIMSAQYLTRISKVTSGMRIRMYRLSRYARVSSEFYIGPSNNVPMHDGVTGIWTHFVPLMMCTTRSETMEPVGKGSIDIPSYARHMTQSYPAATDDRARATVVAWRSSGFMNMRRPGDCSPIDR